jgi:hypothetical protein
LGLARGEDELNLETIGRMNINDRAEITTTQAMLGEIPIQDDSVEQVEHGYPGCAVMKRVKFWPLETIQTVTTLA